MKHLVEEFTADWLLAQRAKTTARMYSSYLVNLFALHEDPTFTQTKQWIGSPVRFHVKDNLMLDIEEYVSVEVQTTKRVQRFSSIFSGINTLVEQLNQSHIL